MDWLSWDACFGVRPSARRADIRSAVTESSNLSAIDHVDLTMLEDLVIADSIVEEDEAEAPHDVLFFVLDDADVLDVAELAEVGLQVAWVGASLPSVMS